jgi:NitT/TauT family transport system ATP-binding protein
VADGNIVTMTGAPKLVAQKVSKWFATRDGNFVHALQAVDLTIRSGEFVSIVGASGCGKTTFLRIVDGLETFDSGEVDLDGKALTSPGWDRGVVFQQDLLLPWRTVEQNVWLGLEAQGRPIAERRRVAQQVVELVGLSGRERAYPHELSGGMRQRVNLARAMALDPELLLMDEPFAALDAQTREVMQKELLRIWNEQRKTVLFVTHQIDEAVYLSDRVVVFSARPGRVKADIPIHIPRPRALNVKRTPEFLEYSQRIWELIEEEVMAAVAIEQRG